MNRRPLSVVHSKKRSTTRDATIDKPSQGCRQAKPRHEANRTSTSGRRGHRHKDSSLLAVCWVSCYYSYTSHNHHAFFFTPLSESGSPRPISRHGCEKKTARRCHLDRVNPIVQTFADESSSRRVAAPSVKYGPPPSHASGAAAGVCGSGNRETKGSDTAAEVGGCCCY